jgi:hypothetical protein
MTVEDRQQGMSEHGRTPVEYAARETIARGRIRCYLWSGGGMLKRIADWLEKVSVAAFAVGIFQGQFLWGLTVTVTALIGCLVITKRLEGGK